MQHFGAPVAVILCGLFFAMNLWMIDRAKEQIVLPEGVELADTEAAGTDFYQHFAKYSDEALTQYRNDFQPKDLVFAVSIGLFLASVMLACLNQLATASPWLWALPWLCLLATGIDWAEAAAFRAVIDSLVTPGAWVGRAATAIHAVKLPAYLAAGAAAAGLLATVGWHWVSRR